MFHEIISKLKYSVSTSAGSFFERHAKAPRDAGCFPLRICTYASFEFCISQVIWCLVHRMVTVTIPLSLLPTSACMPPSPKSHDMSLCHTFPTTATYFSYKFWALPTILHNLSSRPLLCKRITSLFVETRVRKTIQEVKTRQLENALIVPANRLGNSNSHLHSL